MREAHVWVKNGQLRLFSQWCVQWQFMLGQGRLTGHSCGPNMQILKLCELVSVPVTARHFPKSLIETDW